MRFIATLTILALGLLRLSAQSVTVLDDLHTFSPLSSNPALNGEGAFPAASLILSGTTLYGTAASGGEFGYGTVFQISTNGSDFTTLYEFTNGLDGATPMAPLLLTNGVLYGTASGGGASGFGTIFSIALAGTNFTALYSFTNGLDGAKPENGLILAGPILFGTTSGTASGSSYGSLFMVNTNGSNFVAMHRFSAPTAGINNDGFTPTGLLCLQGNLLYGVTSDGGRHGTGTIFESPTNGSSFDTLYSFAAVSPSLANNGGAYPDGGVILSGSALYGAAHYGGVNSYGTIYEYDTNGTGLNPIYSFTGADDYIYPQGPLTLSSNMLYGTTGATIFALTTNGEAFTNIFSVTNPDDFGPNGGLLLYGQSFFGATQDGGTNGDGTIFVVSTEPAPVPLAIQRTSNTVTLTWTNSLFILQSAAALTDTFTNVPGAISPCTVSISGTQAFFRLIAN